MTLKKALVIGLAVVLPVVVVMSVAPACAAEKPAAQSMAQTHDFTAKQVERLQLGLAKSGQEVAIDGIWGKETTQALRTFQKEHGLKVTGFINAQTTKALPTTD
jgi:peptidoglycan hydrolase-like protein with peptidoglycan-binding domain